MREKLKEIKGKRQRFIGTFARFGIKKAFKGPPVKTLLFQNIRGKDGKEYCDHIWFVSGKQFEVLDLKPGDQICFDARVKPYEKGYKGRNPGDYDVSPVSTDYKLSHPNNIVKHVEGAQGQLF